MDLHLHLGAFTRIPTPFHIKLETVPTSELETVKQQLAAILNTQMDINARLAKVETDLNEASTEILSELGKLRAESLTAEGQETLTRLESKATALAAIIPNEPAPEPAAE